MKYRAGLPPMRPLVDTTDDPSFLEQRSDELGSNASMTDY